MRVGDGRGRGRLEHTERSWVVQGVVEGGGDGVTGCNADAVGSCVQLVATDVVRGHIADVAVVLPVVGLAYDSPVCGAVEARECVCWVGGQHGRFATVVEREPGREGGLTVSGGRGGDESEDGEGLHFG